MDAVAYSKDEHAHEHPLFHLLGNHDVYFNGWNDFMEHIGPSTYWFEVRFNSGADLYIALDTASGTLGGKQTEWLEKFLENEREKYRYCIILSHTNFFYTDKCQVSTVNMPIDETLSLSRLLATYNVNLVLQRHNHFREDRIYDNVRYIVIGAIGDETKAPEYLKIKVQASGMTYDWILL